MPANSNNTKTEGDQKTDATADDPDGTSAQWDVGVSHLITTFYAYFVFVAISLGGYIFFLTFEPFSDNLTCDSGEPLVGQYFGVQDILSKITDYDSCLANIDDIFNLVDLNRDGYIDRCEDASFQKHLGSSQDFALKYSSSWDRASYKTICGRYSK